MVAHFEFIEHFFELGLQAGQTSPVSDLNPAKHPAQGHVQAICCGWHQENGEHAHKVLLTGECACRLLSYLHQASAMSIMMVSVLIMK